MAKTSSSDRSYSRKTQNMEQGDLKKRKLLHVEANLENADKGDEITELTKESTLFYNWQSSSEEPEAEDVVDPCLLTAVNLDLSITKADINKFFAGIAEPEVSFRREEDKNGNLINMHALLRFSSLEETQAAFSLKGEDLIGSPAYLLRYPNGLKTICITGFDPQKSEQELCDEIGEKLETCGDIVNIFIPRSLSTNSYFGFCYFFMETEVDGKMGDFMLQISDVNLKSWVIKSIMEGNFKRVVEKIDTLKKILEENKQRWERDKETDQKVAFSWRENSDLFVGYEQKANECWAVTLYRGQLAARKLSSHPSDSDLTIQKIIDGVDPRHLFTGEGIDKMKNAKPFMLSHVKDMEVHHRPRSGNEEDFYSFEKETIALAMKVPVAVTVDFIPSYRNWDGHGIFCPSEIDLLLNVLEKDPYHGLVISGCGFEDGIPYFEMQDSYGEE